MNKSQKILSLIAEGEIFQEDNFVFTLSTLEGDRVNGTLAYAGASYEGYIAYNEDNGGVDWDFIPPLPDSIIMDDLWLNMVGKILSSYINEV